MRRITFSVCLSVAAGGALVAVSPAAAQDTCYRIVDLGALGFTPIIDDVFGINNANQAVFTAEVNGTKHAMLYLPLPAYGLAAGLHDLNTVFGLDPALETAAHDLNDVGIAVGRTTVAGQKHAFVWRLDADPFEFIDLGTFPDANWSEAFAINDVDPPIIVGEGEYRASCNCTGGLHPLRRAFALELTGPDVDLLDAAQLVHAPPDPCVPNTISRDVNTPGVGDLLAVGTGFTGGGPCGFPGSPCDGQTVAMVWINPDPINSPVVGIDLPDLSENGERASGASDQGSIVGFGYTAGNAPDCELHALYWDTDTGPLVDLGLAMGVDPGAETRAVRINNNQSPQTLQAVGWDLSGQALLWECDGNCDQLANWSATDLNDTIQHCSNNWLIRQAHDVNDDGWIIGVGTFSGQNHAVLLMPLANCCDADLDGNGEVGASDLLALLAAWGPCPAPPAACDADLDCDGDVGASDLLILLAAWGPCGFPIATGPPQDIQDCMTRFCCDPEDELALIKCLELVTQ